MYRDHTKVVQIGNKKIGGGNPILIQSMTNTKTEDVEATVRQILELDEPIGRKLDFLTQELNRESNTIGSKCQDVAVTRLVVELKSEIEKIREQIQNIE